MVCVLYLSIWTNEAGSVQAAAVLNRTLNLLETVAPPLPVKEEKKATEEKKVETPVTKPEETNVPVKAEEEKKQDQTAAPKEEKKAEEEKKVDTSAEKKVEIPVAKPEGANAPAKEVEEKKQDQATVPKKGAEPLVKYYAMYKVKTIENPPTRVNNMVYSPCVSYDIDTDQAYVFRVASKTA
ncbi:MAG: hypothetical protein P4M11_08515 [Candidatus Pacebacteria bacterium]|nr:hypothetical protein [Candidatus Paceibacterota bacterium]